MKGYYVGDHTIRRSIYSRVYRCDHPLYNECTLYERNGQGLAVIQQRFNPKLKMTWWGPVDPWLADDIYSEDKFLERFLSLSNFMIEGLYPTIEVRKLMYQLAMKPMMVAFWESSLSSQKLQVL